MTLKEKLEISNNQWQSVKLINDDKFGKQIDPIELLDIDNYELFVSGYLYKNNDTNYYFMFSGLISNWAGARDEATIPSIKGTLTGRVVFSKKNGINLLEVNELVKTTKIQKKKSYNGIVINALSVMKRRIK